MDDPLWEKKIKLYGKEIHRVLIPILMDDPLWVMEEDSIEQVTERS